MAVERAPATEGAFELGPTGYPPVTRAVLAVYLLLLAPGLALTVDGCRRLELPLGATKVAIPILAPWLAALALLELWRVADFRSARVAITGKGLVWTAGVLREITRLDLARAEARAVTVRGPDALLETVRGPVILPFDPAAIVEALGRAWPELLVRAPEPRARRTVPPWALALAILGLAALAELVRWRQSRAHAELQALAAIVRTAVARAQASTVKRLTEAESERGFEAYADDTGVRELSGEYGVFDFRSSFADFGTMLSLVTRARSDRSAVYSAPEVRVGVRTVVTLHWGLVFPTLDVEIVPYGDRDDRIFVEEVLRELHDAHVPATVERRRLPR